MIKDKLFRDPVHGYIHIPSDICESIIDTPIFQRLRDIEQTSIRVLFPGARHDRFLHSLGVYHLGKKAFDCLKRNIGENLKNQNKPDWETYKNTFTCACLLHDCCHAPFSHTFESYYDQKISNDTDAEKFGLSDLDQQIIDELNDDNFKQDYCQIPIKRRPAPHEKASTLVFLKFFNKNLKEHDIDVDECFLARMILGCRYKIDNAHLENTLIDLLNGSAIDVDKLDYIMRDTWASGASGVVIDIDRLLSAITVNFTTHYSVSPLAFNKSVLSVLQNVINGKNFLYQWIIPHHKVVYCTDLLTKSVAKLGKDYHSKFFSVDAVLDHVVIDGVIFRRPSDSDLISILKQKELEIPMIGEYFSRSYNFFPLWKTHLEYKQLFGKVDSSFNCIDECRKLVNSELEKLAGENSFKKCFALDLKPSSIRIKSKDIWIEYRSGKMVDYNEAFGLYPELQKSERFFYLFVPMEFKNHKFDLLDKIMESF